jgi:hypothetical protein
VGGATLSAGDAHAWLLADAGRRLWVAANLSDEAVPFRLQTPDGSLECDAFGFGRVIWRGAQAQVEVDAATLTSPVRLSGPRGLNLRVNGKDVTGRLRRGRGQWRILDRG